MGSEMCIRDRSYFKLCKEVYAKVGMRQLDSDECVFVNCAQNIKGQPPLTVEHIIESGAFMTMDTVPEDQHGNEHDINLFGSSLLRLMHRV